MSGPRAISARFLFQRSSDQNAATSCARPMWRPNAIASRFWLSSRLLISGIAIALIRRRCMVVVAIEALRTPRACARARSLNATSTGGPVRLLCRCEPQRGAQPRDMAFGDDGIAGLAAGLTGHRSAARVGRGFDARRNLRTATGAPAPHCWAPACETKPISSATAPRAASTSVFPHSA